MILILGGDGQLANSLHLKLKNSIKINRKICDITKKASLINLIIKHKPKYIFNCAAYHNTILCEKNVGKAFMINSFAVKFLSELSNIYNFKLIHFSTDYVFDGKKNSPYIENDIPNPINIYGQSKLLGEFFIKEYSKNYLIIRISSIYSHFPCRHKKGLNFVDKMLNLSKLKKELKINDLKISPTYVGDIVNQVIKIYPKVNNEIVHCASTGSSSWFDFAKEIFKNYKIKVKISKVKNFDQDSIKRPNYTVLKNEFLIKKKLNTMPNWKLSFKNYFKAQNSKKTIP